MIRDSHIHFHSGETNVIHPKERTYTAYAKKFYIFLLLLLLFFFFDLFCFLKNKNKKPSVHTNLSDSW